MPQRAEATGFERSPYRLTSDEIRNIVGALYRAFEFGLLHAHQVPDADWEGEELREIFGDVCEDIPMKLRVLSLSCEARGLDSAPLADLATRWGTLTRTHPGYKATMVNFREQFDDEFLIEKLRTTTQRLLRHAELEDSLTDEKGVRIARSTPAAAAAEPAPATNDEKSGRLEARPSSSKAESSTPTWTSVKELTLALEPAAGRRRSDLVLRLSQGTDAKPLEHRISGPTAPYLAKIVIEQPDQDHTWDEVWRTGNDRSYWKSATPSSLERLGRKVRRALPVSLKGRWEQNSASVRWNTGE